MPPAGTFGQASSSSEEKSREKWLFVSTALVMLMLCLASFAVVALLNAGFVQVRTGAIEVLLMRSAAIGVIVMASIQTVRAIIPVRSRFHRQKVKTWLRRADDESRRPPEFRERMREAVKGYRPPPPPTPDGGSPSSSGSSPGGEPETPPLEPYVRPETTEQDILDELLRLTTAEGADRPEVSLAFFDLPLEQLCGQISAGAERAIVDPRSHGPILLRLANAAGEEDVLELFKAHYQQPPTDKGADERYVRARARVEERVRRSIDCLQIESGFYWRRRLRGLAVALAAVLGLTAALVASQWLASVPAALATGFISGFFAMLARDLTAIVERLRRVP